MKKNENKIVYCICLIISILIFIPFFMGHVTGDTYNIEGIGYENYALNYNLKDGRPFIALFNIVTGKLALPIQTYMRINLFIALVVSNISVILIKNIVEKYKRNTSIKHKIIATSISYATIFNFMYIDCLNFAECSFISLSVLLYLISAYILCENKKGAFLKSGILNGIAILCYQSSISMFFTGLFLFTILKNKNDIKTILKDLAKGTIIAIIALSINFIAIKVAGFLFELDQNRVKISIDIILKNIKLTFSNIFTILNESCGMFPKSLFLVYIIVIMVLGIIYAIKSKMEDLFLYKFFIVIIVSILSSFVLNIISISSFNGGRTRLSIGATIGFIMIYMYIESDIFKSNKIFAGILNTILASYLVINIYNYEYLIIQVKRLDVLEKREMAEIVEYITEYEEKSNIKVEKILKVLFVKQGEKQFYKELPRIPFTSSTIRSSEFAEKALNCYSGKKIEATLVRSDSEYVERYTSIEENDKGYECIDDTLYLSVYAY